MIVSLLYKVARKLPSTPTRPARRGDPRVPARGLTWLDGIFGRRNVAGVTRNVTAEWATQQARNLLTTLDEVCTAGIRYLIRDNAATSPRPSTRFSPPSAPAWYPSFPEYPG